MRLSLGLVAILLLTGCTVGKHRNEVTNAASSFNTQMSTTRSLITTAITNNYELNRATYYLDQSSATAFDAYNSGTGAYTVQVYSNSTREFRFEDSNGNALAVMGTASPFVRDNALNSQVAFVRVQRDSRDVRRAIALPNHVNGTLSTGITISSGTVNTLGNIVTPVLTWLPETGHIQGTHVDITFSNSVGTGTITQGSRTAEVMVMFSGTNANSFGSSLTITSLAAPETGFNPMASLGYTNE